MIEEVKLITEAAALGQYSYLREKSEIERKNLGQYFTVAPVAEYMASMIEPTDASLVRILDAGAGAGILTISAALRCLELGNNMVHAVLYEIDYELIEHLEANMKQITRQFRTQGGKFSFEIRNEDFVLSESAKTDAPFHVSSINPPYFKYNSKTSPYAGATADLFRGNPNIYASFMALVANYLTPGGQMVAIVPRSFTNGLYFRGFRHYFNRTMSLDKLHIFRCRDKVFKDLSVLQENVICTYTKRCQSAQIDLRTSAGYEDLDKAETRRYPAKLLIDKTNAHEIIRIPESSNDAAILQIVNGWPSSFQGNGYFISTGPVVEHRAREYIATPNCPTNSVPLLRMHNIKPFKTVWTGKNKKDACFRLLEGHCKLTLENRPYVILKRFSSKDEKRRLVAGVHDPQVVKARLIALENHLNYMGHAYEELDMAEVYGLATVFNSTFMDKYFRCVSGNTQVNATEVRLLKLPTREVIRQVGAAFLAEVDADQKRIDSIVSFHLELKESAAA